MMRLTLWQQFSSNHSADFTIVAQFESAAWAHEAASEVRALVQSIGQWWEQYENLDELDELRALLRERGEITPPELSLRLRYEVEWQYQSTGRIAPIDWIYGAYPDETLEEYVQVYRDLIVMTHPGDTWIGPQPFDQILHKLGGEVACDCEIYDSYLMMTLTCLAPAEATAQAMLNESRPSQLRNGIWCVTLPDMNTTYCEIVREGQRITYQNYQLYSIAFARTPKMKLDRFEVKEARRLNCQQQIQGVID